MNNKILVFLSIISTLIILEFSFKIFIFNQNEYNYKNRYLLFSGKNVFKNIENFFTYYPNKKINAINYYLENDKFIKVYDYNIYTNNYGLAQKHNIDKNKKSILFIGDSFTEGQGHKSWIDSFNGSYNGYQIINGGLLGTGFQQFELIDNYLSSFNISKLFILYIGDDLKRDIFQFNKQQLNCLNDYHECTGNELFYGMPANSNDTLKFVNSLSLKKKEFSNERDLSFEKIKKKIKNFLSNLYIIRIPVDFLKSNFNFFENNNIKKNTLVIDRFIKKYGKNVYFISLNTKQEIANNKKSYETIFAKEYIKKKNKQFFSM